jgi:hypothetical protein
MIPVCADNKHEELGSLLTRNAGPVNHAGSV